MFYNISNVGSGNQENTGYYVAPTVSGRRLRWLMPHRESLEYCQEEDETPEVTMQKELKAAIEAVWAP